jgi:L-lysine 2,3-aminomutase
LGKIGKLNLKTGVFVHDTNNRILTIVSGQCAVNCEYNDKKEIVAILVKAKITIYL